MIWHEARVFVRITFLFSTHTGSANRLIGPLSEFVFPLIVGAGLQSSPILKPMINC